MSIRETKHYRHPLRALFGVAAWTASDGMAWIVNRGGLVSDNWERVPAPEEIPWSEVVRIFQFAKARFPVAYCDAVIASIERKSLSETNP